jgi:hypothetical protein
MATNNTEINDNSGAVAQAMGNVTGALASQAQTDKQFGSDLNQGAQSLSRAGEKIEYFEQQGLRRSAMSSIANGKAALSTAQTAMDGATTYAQLNTAQKDYNTYNTFATNAAAKNLGAYGVGVNSEGALDKARLSDYYAKATQRITTNSQANQIDTAIAQGQAAGGNIDAATTKLTLGNITTLLNNPNARLTMAQRSRFNTYRVNLSQGLGGPTSTTPTTGDASTAPAQQQHQDIMEVVSHNSFHNTQIEQAQQVNAQHVNQLILSNIPPKDLPRLNYASANFMQQKQQLNDVYNYMSVLSKSGNTLTDAQDKLQDPNATEGQKAVAKSTINLIEKDPYTYLEGTNKAVEQASMEYRNVMNDPKSTPAQQVDAFQSRQAQLKMAAKERGIPFNRLNTLAPANTAHLTSESLNYTDAHSYQAQIRVSLDNQKTMGGKNAPIGGNGLPSQQQKYYNISPGSEVSSLVTASYNPKMAVDVNKQYATLFGKSSTKDNQKDEYINNQLSSGGFLGFGGEAMTDKMKNLATMMDVPVNQVSNSYSTAYKQLRLQGLSSDDADAALDKEMNAINSPNNIESSPVYQVRQGSFDALGIHGNQTYKTRVMTRALQLSLMHKNKGANALQTQATGSWRDYTVKESNGQFVAYKDSDSSISSTVTPTMLHTAKDAVDKNPDLDRDSKRQLRVSTAGVESIFDSIKKHSEDLVPKKLAHNFEQLGHVNET